LLILIAYKKFTVFAASLLNKKFLDLDNTGIITSASQRLYCSRFNWKYNPTYPKIEAENTSEMVF